MFSFRQTDGGSEGEPTSGRAREGLMRGACRTTLLDSSRSGCQESSDIAGGFDWPAQMVAFIEITNEWIR